MNIFNKVTLESLKKNRTRTIVTIIGIILSAAMICAVTSFTSSFMNYLQQGTIYSTGDWHGSELDTYYSLYEDIVGSDEIEHAVYMQQLGYAKLENCRNEYKPYIFILGGSENAENVMPIHITKGSYPTSADEILLPNHLAENGGVIYHIGDTLTLKLGNRMFEGWPMTQNNPCYIYEGSKAVLLDETIEVRETRTYTVVGFYERPSFENRTAPGYTAITLADSKPKEDCLYNIYYKMKNPHNIYKFMEGRNLSSNDNRDLLLYSGVSKYDNFTTMLYGLAGIVIGLIMFGSVSLIYNAFSISVSERTKQFGLLSSIGATKSQLRRSVIFEALAVSVIGIPLGIISGIVGIGITLYFVGNKFMILGFPVKMKLSVSFASIIIATVVALITVLISAWIPSKRATNVSAVEAIRQNLDVHAQSKPVKTSKLMYKLFGLPGVLANKHYKRSKKKYRATIVSLFMSIVLFVSASAFTDYLMESVSGGFATYGYDLYYFSHADAHSEISAKELLELFREDGNLTDSAYTYTRYLTAEMNKEYLSKEAVLRSDSLNHIETKDDSFAPVSIVLRFVNDDTFEALLEQNGLDKNVFMNPEEPLAVAIDGSRYFDYDKGKYVYLSMLGDDYCEANLSLLKDYDGYTHHGMETDLEGNEYILYESLDNPEEILRIPEAEAYEPFMLKSGKTIYDWPFFATQGNGLTFIYPESMRDIMFPTVDSSRYEIKFMFCSDNHSASYTTLKQTLSENGFEAGSLSDYAASVEDERNLVTIIKVFSYGFIALISLIAAANVFNTISTNIGLRRREFAMLKSVGMSAKSFNKMMNFECLLYSSRALLYGLPVSVFITWLIYLAVSEGYSTGFHLPWTAIGIAVLSVFIVVGATMMYSMSKIKKDNPIDALKNENL